MCYVVRTHLLIMFYHDRKMEGGNKLLYEKSDYMNLCSENKPSLGQLFSLSFLAATREFVSVFDRFSRDFIGK